MDEMKKLELFLDVQRTCMKTLWHQENGLDMENMIDEPHLTMSMFNSDDFSDNETAMVLEIHEALDEPISSGSINLHLRPELFFVSLEPPKGEPTVVLLDKPTKGQVFVELEKYFRSLGSPATDKQFFEGLVNVQGGQPNVDVTPFMGS